MMKESFWRNLLVLVGCLLIASLLFPFFKLGAYHLLIENRSFSGPFRHAHLALLRYFPVALFFLCFGFIVSYLFKTSQLFYWVLLFGICASLISYIRYVMHGEVSGPIWFRVLFYMKFLIPPAASVLGFVIFQKFNGCLTSRSLSDAGKNNLNKEKLKNENVKRSKYD